MPGVSKKQILIAVDGSLQAMEAVRYVSAILPARKIRVVLLHVVTKVPESFLDLSHEPAYRYRLVNIEEWEERQKQAVDEFMEHAQELLLKAGIPREDVSAIIRDRNEGIARDIIAESRKGYEVVVIGRSGVSELKDFVLGGIASKLVQGLSNCPLWIVGGTPSAEKLLLCMDGSEGATRAVQYTADILEGTPHMEVTLVHMIKNINIFRQMFGSAFQSSKTGGAPQKEGLEVEEARKSLEPAFHDARKVLLQAGFPPGKITEHVQSGVSSQAGGILDYAEREGYGTIVVGRRGLTKVQEFFMGSVSSKVVQLARDRAVWVVN